MYLHGKLMLRSSNTMFPCLWILFYCFQTQMTIGIYAFHFSPVTYLHVHQEKPTMNRKKYPCRKYDGYNRVLSSQLQTLYATRAEEYESKLMDMGIENQKKKKEGKILIEDSSNDWDLQDDWLLIDQVQLFTVTSTTTEAASRNHQQTKPIKKNTFWAQLRHSSPILSKHTEDDLKARYKFLKQEKRQIETKNEDKMITTSQKIIQNWESPELLTHWWIETHTSSSVSLQNNVHEDDLKSSNIHPIMMMGGILSNGSKICFPLSHTGTLLGNHQWCDDLNNQNWDYAVTIGGQIYELGMQRDGISAIDPLSSASSEISRTIQSFKDSLKIPKLSGSLKPYGYIMAILAASFLSAMVVLPKDPNQQQPSTSFVISDQAPTNIVMKPPELQISVPSIPPHSTSSQTEILNMDRTDMTIKEQRAMQELRVERDKMILQSTQGKLQMDEFKLKELVKEENRLEAISYGFY